MSIIKEGDLVMLMCGGPIMTVSHVSTNGKAVKCHWFEKRTLHDGEFNNEELNVKKYCYNLNRRNNVTPQRKQEQN